MELDLKSQIAKNTEIIQTLIKKIDGIYDEWMDIDTVVNYTKLSMTTILKYQDQIGYFKKERRKVFNRKDVDNFMKQNQIKRI